MKPLLCLMLLSTTLASQAERPALLLLPFENSTGDVRNDALESGIPDILSACLAEFADAVVVVDRSIVEPVLREQGLGIEEYADPSRQQRIGQIIGADFAIRGSLTLIDGALHVELLAFSVTTTTLAHSDNAILGRTSIIEDICTRLAPSLAGKLAAMPSTQATVRIAEPENRLLLMSGLKSYYTGAYVEALAPFLKLIRLDSQDEAAHFWLAQSFAGAGLNDYARVQLEDFLTRFPGSARMNEVRKQLAGIVQETIQ